MKKRAKCRLRIATAIMALLLCIMTAVALASCKKNDDPQVDPPPAVDEGIAAEVGAYYYDVAERDEEYLLTLNTSHKFSFSVNNTLQNGDYTLDGETLTLRAGEWSLQALLQNDVVTLEFEGAQMRFLKKKDFTVSFEANGGSATAAVTVLNGKTVAKPADPAREGYAFVGWYTDAAFKQPYSFESAAVVDNMTLYARWAEKSATYSENVISFDLGYEAQNPESRETINGKLYEAPVPTREGYTFKGWYVSADNTAAMLSYKWEEESTVFGSDTTLYAVWQENGATHEAPDVSVSAGAVRWDAVSGVNRYGIRITGPDGAELVNQYIPATTFTYSFNTTGTYKVEVTAADAAGNAISATTVRYYTANALERVSGITVIEPAVLVYRGVPNAEKYLITVKCGNPAHQHTLFDNGTSTQYTFINCDMQEGGIVFEITAIADGYASSTSTFKWEKNLAAVEAVKVENDVVTWAAVRNATGYEVKVGDVSFTVTGTEFSLKNFDNGTLTVSVKPVAKGYNAPAAKTVTYVKNTLAAPTDIQVNGTLVSWNGVTGANSYEVSVGGRTATVTDATSYDIADLVNWIDAADYQLTVKAIGSAEAAVSDPVAVRYAAMGKLSYAGSILSWTPVVGVTSYEVQINDGEIVTVSTAYYEVETLACAGENTLRVRCGNSEWSEIKVYAHTVLLDSRGGEEPSQTLYKAVGDKMNLGLRTKTGYVFDSWYNTISGPAGNGSAYTDAYFNAPGDVTLYAYYTPKPITVQFNYGEGETGTVTEDTVYYNQNFTMPAPVSGEATRMFGGWFTLPYGAGTQLTDSFGTSLIRWDNLDDEVTVYAFWVDCALKFTKVGNGYAVTQGDRISLVTELTIPATYNGLPVTEIAGSAFENCTSLQVVNIPGTVTKISAETAFKGCTNLKEVNIYSAGVQDLRYSTQDGVLFDAGEAGNRHAPIPVFMPSFKTGTYRIPYGVETIPHSAFAGSKISKFIIPASVSVIEADAFSQCTNLTTVLFEQAPAGAATAASLSIGDRAFYKCTALESITLPQRLTSISTGRYLFNSDGSINTNASTVADAFGGCSKLTVINVARGNSNFTAVDGVLFSDGGSTLLYFPAAKTAVDYQIPGGVSAIAAGAFVGASKVTGTLALPGTVAEIGEFAFYKSGITALTFKAGGLSAVHVGEYAFAESKVANITFEQGSNVSSYGAYAFYKCTSLKNIVIPATMTAIGDHAFDSCGTVEISFDGEGRKSVSFGDSVFNACTIATFNISANMTAVPGFLNGLKVTTIVVDPANTFFASDAAGVLYSKNAAGEMDALIYYPSGKTDTTFEIPATVTTIAAGVFKGNQSLRNITIPASVTLIGVEAFCESAITNLTFATEAGEPLDIATRAFYRTPNLTAINLPDRTRSIGSEAFARYVDPNDYEHWDESELEGSSVTSITLGNSLVSIGDRAFYCVGAYGAGLEIVIPATVKTIGASAFATGSTPFIEISSKIASVAFAAGSQIESIGDNAFNGAITAGNFTLTLPASLKTIGTGAFRNVGASAIVIESGSVLEIIGAEAFYDCRMTTFTVPASVKVIGASAFRGNKLTEIIFEDGMVDLVLGDKLGASNPGKVFANQSNLKTIHFPGRLVVLSTDALNGASVQTVTFGHYTEGDNLLTSRLTTIGESAFWACRNLTAITIPASVRNTADAMGIGKTAFGSCGNLVSVTFEASDAPLTLGQKAFGSCAKLTSLTLPARLTDFTDASGNVTKLFALGADEFTNSGITAFAFDGTGAYTANGAMILSADGRELILCSPAITGTVTIPATVERIAENAFNSAKMTAVVFETGSKCVEIGDKAFQNCKSLLEVTLADSVETLGTQVFLNCSNMTSLVLSANLKNYDPDVVKGCTKLQSITVGGSGSGYVTVGSVLFSADMKKLISYPVTLTQTIYTVPEGVTEISAKAFNGNTSLQTIILPASLELIDVQAFKGCSALTTVTFTADGNAYLTIGAEAFCDTAIASITIPARVVSIGNEAFAISTTTVSNRKLTSVTFEADSVLASIGSGAFRRALIENIVLPDSVTSIGSEAFSECANLTSITMPASLETLGSKVFNKCEKLLAVDIRGALKTMGAGVFTDCKELNRVSFAPEATVAVLACDTFAGCAALREVNFHAGLTAIEAPEGSENTKRLFGSSPELETVTFAEGSKLITIGEKAFSGTSLSAIEIPSGVVSLDREAFSGTKLTSIVIPRTVTRLGYNVFSDCKQLTDVVIGEGITELPTGTFYGCSRLTTLHIPANVARITNYAGLNQNWSFKGFTVDPANKAYKAKNGVLYTADWELVMIPVSMSEYVIPVEVSTLPADVMLKWNLTSISLEDGVTAFVDDNGVILDAARTTIYFLNKRITSFNLPASITDNGFVALLLECEDLATITVEAGNPAFRVAFGALYDMEWNLLVFPRAMTVFTIPKEVTELPAKIFEGSALTTVTFEDGGTKDLVLNGSSQGGVFAGCSHLQTVELPPRTTYIGSRTFYWCESLTTVTLPGTIREIVLSDPSDAQASAFCQCIALESIIMSEDGTYYHALGGVLYNNAWEIAVFPANLTEWIIPHQLTVIPALSTFATLNADGFKLTTVRPETDSDGNEIPGDPLRVADDAFKGMTSLQSLTLPARTISVGKNALSGCTALQTLNAPDGVEGLNFVGGVLYDENWNILLFPSAVTEWIIPHQMTTIPKLSAFNKKIKTIKPETDADGNEIAGPAMTMVEEAFRELGSLTSVVLPNRIEEISEHAFWYCDALTSLKIPASVTTIGELAFDGCTSLTLYIPKTVTTVGSDILGSDIYYMEIYIEYEDYESPYGYYPGDTTWLGANADWAYTITWGATMPE